MLIFDYHYVKNVVFSRAFAVVACVALCSATMTGSGQGQDKSNRTSLLNRKVIESWENGTAGFTASHRDTRLKTQGAVPGWSTKVYDGEQCLSAKFPKGEAANTRRILSKDFPEGLDLAGRTMIEYGIMAAEGPGKDFFTTLTLFDKKGNRFECEAYFIPSLWRGILFDVSDCGFLSDIRRIEIAAWCDSPKPWDTPNIMIDGLCAGTVADMDFNTPGSEKAFTSVGKGKLSRRDGILRYDFKRGSALEFRADTSNNNLYNPPLEVRNTLRLVMQNKSNADSLRISFITESDTVFDHLKSKAIAIQPNSAMQVVEVNLSDNRHANGHLKGFRIEPSGKGGTLLIDRITFERESPILPNAGKILSCKANGSHLTVRGQVDNSYLTPGARLQLRHAPLYRSELPADSLELLGECAATKLFALAGIPNSRLNGKMTHLSSRLAMYLKSSDGTLTPVGEPFYIENWRDFCSNPYAFENPATIFAVEDYGAKGDGFTNDNAAIQQAIDAAAEAGGGTVVLSAGADGREREYLATDLRLKGNVTLFVAPGAVLRQSGIADHYTSYRLDYGHDNIIPGIPWTHSMYTNMPLILAKDTHNIKITGGGKIRMDDTYSENRSWTHYAKNCSDRIHIVPIAVCNTNHVEISDIDINRCNNYHTIFYRADSVYIGNVKLVEVACLSGDGVSLGNAVTNVNIDRLIFESNDDGIVLASSYKDPRGGNWRERVDTIDSSVRNINVCHSYIDSNRGGGGKAIAFIPWGSTNPRQDYNEIDNIRVTDCVLRGGHSVGTWPDNPFDGKVFMGDERDDYAPVKNIDIRGNEYLSLCDLMWVEPTTFVTDCGIKSSSQLKNPEFADRTAYWSRTGKVTAVRPGLIEIDGGCLYQGLTLEPGTYRITLDGDEGAVAFAAKPDSTENLCNEEGQFAIDAEGLQLVGAKADGKARIMRVILEKIN